MQTAQRPECICRSRYRFGLGWGGMGSTERATPAANQPRLLRIRANLNQCSAQRLSWTGLAYNYRRAYGRYMHLSWGRRNGPGACSQGQRHLTGTFLLPFFVRPWLSVCQWHEQGPGPR